MNSFTVCPTEKTFEGAYMSALEKVVNQGIRTVSRKGTTLVELPHVAFSFEDPLALSLPSRAPSRKYTEGEMEWYMSGSYSVEEATKLSKVWAKCTDDGKTVNSNYGALIFHERNEKGLTPFEHAVNCLESSRQSKKAVIPLYTPEHSYMSKDNPCTMHLHFRITRDEHQYAPPLLNCTAVMRSNDLFYGTPYDVRFFVFVQWMVQQALLKRGRRTRLGSYTHFVHSLHYYEDKEKTVKEILARGKFKDTPQAVDHRWGQRVCHKYWKDLFKKHEGSFSSNTAAEKKFMEAAWKEAEESHCLKKNVGAAFTYSNSAGEELLFCTHGGALEKCQHCFRDDEKDKYYGDQCPSVHSEMQGVVRLLRQGTDLDNVKVYVTHGPCDACLKLLNLVGIREVVYDEPYKTNYDHWPDINVRRLTLNSGAKGKKGE